MTIFMRFGAKLQGDKMTLERWHFIGFLQRLIGLLVKSVYFSSLCCIICQWWQ